MTGQHLLLLIGLTSAMAAATLWRKALSWALVNGAFLVAAGVGYWLDPERAGLVLIGPYLLLTVVPLVALIWVNRMLVARRYRIARALAWIAYVLHPSRGQRNLVRLGDVFDLAAQGDLDAAAQVLRETGHEEHMKIELLRLQNRWADLLAHVDSVTQQPLEHPGAVLYLRALGETGQVDRFVAFYQHARAAWSKRDDMTNELATARLFVAAFLGQLDIVEQICAGPLRDYDHSIKQYWRGVAHDVGGDRDKAAAIWAELSQDDEARMRGAAAYRAANRRQRLDELSPAHAQLVGELAAEVRDVLTYGTSQPRGRAVLSYGIAAVLVAIHAGIALYGEEHVLYEVVFWSPAVLDGDYARIATAMVVHASWLHVAMNVLGLVWFGPFVEQFLGRIRFAVVFVLGGIGGYVVLAALDYIGWREPTAALGASGSLMALIGASIAIFWRGSTRSTLAAGRLRDMLGFVGMQVVFDILAPRVSMTAHLTGLVVGFVLGLVIKPRDN